MKIIKYLQLPVKFNALRLREELEHISGEQWLAHYQTLQYRGNWTAIPLRSVGGEIDIRISPTDEAVYHDTVFLDKAHYTKEVLSWFRCPLNAVRFLRLGAGAEILEHKDAGLNFESGEVRIHIPVTTHGDVEFFIQKERIVMNEGECWYMNVNLPHSVHNKSNVDRVHLVVDAVVNDWLRACFSEEGVHKKEVEEYDDHTRRAIIENLRSLNTEMSNRLADEMEEAAESQP